MIPTWTYVKGKDGIYANMFIGSTINVERVAGTDVQMVQKTDYPWKGDVSITVNPKQAKRFSVFVRVPNRTTSELYTHTPEVKGLKSLAVNGSPITPKIEKGYAVITRDWKAGDKIELSVPLEVQRIKADDKIAANRGNVALRYGPLIYNVERADNRDLNQALSKGPLTTEWRSDLLGGVVAIKGSWADGSPMLAIPNYARNNRLGQVTANADASDPAIDYSGGASIGTTGAGATTNAATTGQRGAARGGRGRGGFSSSQVWIRDQE
jgi:DUF1680 family protein